MASDIAHIDIPVSRKHSQFVKIALEVGGIPEDPEGTRSNQLVLAVADAEHSGSASSHQVPHGITHQLAVLHFHSQALLALQKQVRLGLGPRHVTALHDHGIFGHAHLSELWLALRRVL